ncbi:hypothetical protein B0O99DRAFT_677390 [Bisporella sp. PMI_857]|nr:hypothetical protein B0O99DRAFT_677390 [Bisporella sp. PMI_857]
MKSITFVALAASAQLASATFNWAGANPFSCPGNTPVTCDDKQKGGFDWSGLDLGDFTDFGGFKFSGFSCASKFGSGKKRDLLTGRTFQDKCITGHASSDKSSSPSFSCSQSKEVEKFSIDEFHVTPEFDCDLQFHYTMPDKSTCKQTSKCSKSGTIVKNTQCGGATDVVVVYPQKDKSKPSKCSIGIHSIGFHCESTTKTKPKPSSTAPPAQVTSPSVPSYTPVTTTPIPTPSTSAQGSTTSKSSPSETPGVPTYTPEVPVPTTTPQAPTTTPQAPTTEVPVPTYTPEVPTTAVTSTAEGSTTQTSVPSIPSTYIPPEDVTVTVITDTTTTFCPVTTTHTSAGTTSIEIGTTVSTVVITSTHTTCNKCTHVPTTPPAVPSSSAAGTPSTYVPSPPSSAASSGAPSYVPSSTAQGSVTTSATAPTSPAVTAPCPELLPQCLNTFVPASSCADNTDAACYCKSAELVCNVFDCLTSHGTAADILSSQTYFQGICAPYIDVNAAIITCKGEVEPDTPDAPLPTVAVPADVTTISVVTTITVPCTESGTTIPGSSTQSVISTAITVPQVVFQTPSAAGTTAPVALVVGTPAPATNTAGIITGVYTTAPIPAATTLATIPAGNGTSPTATPSAVGFTGAAPKLSLGLSSAIAGFVLAIFVL